MPEVHRETDLTTHPCNPADWSTNTFANSLGIVRFADPTTCGAIYVGSGHKVTVNSREIQIVGDPTTCSTVATGSGNVFVN